MNLVLGQVIPCPYCGRKGTVTNKYNDGGLFIVHEVRRTVLEVLPKSKTEIVDARIIDACWRGIESTRDGQRMQEFI